MPLKLNGSTSGYVIVDAPAVAGTNTLTLPAVTDTITTNTATQTLTNKTLSSPTFTGTSSSDISTTGTVVMGSPFTMRNKIINGAMQIAQRGSGVAVTGSTGYYALDRFFAVVNGGTTGAGSKMYQSTSAPSNFQYSLKFGRESGGTSTNAPTIGQVVESVNCYDLQGQTVTFSFYAKAGANYSASGSALTVNLVTGTGTDQGSANIFGSWTGQANNVNNFTLTTSWQRFSFTASIGSSVTEIGFLAYYTPVGTAGADDYFYITGVQLERGTTATPFEYRNFQQELAMCQRYYQTAVSILYGGFYSPGAGTVRSGIFNYPVYMRTTPTISLTLTGSSNYSTPIVDANQPWGFTHYGTTSSSGSFSLGINFTASAEL